MAVEVVDLLTSDEERSFKRDRGDDSDDEVVEVAPPAPKRQEQVKEAVVVLDSDQPYSSPPPAMPPPMQRLITVNYTSLVPGARGQGCYELKVGDTFQEFAQQFSSDIDDIEIRGTGVSGSFTTSWYGTPEIFLIEEPDAKEVKVIVVSREAGSDVEEEPEQTQESSVLIRINTPNGRLEIRVRPDHTIKELVKWVSTKQSVDASKIKVEFDSDKVALTQTIEGLDLEDEDLLDMSW